MCSGEVGPPAKKLGVLPGRFQVGSVQAVQCVYRYGGAGQKRGCLHDGVGNAIKLCCDIGNGRCFDGRGISALDVGRERGRSLDQGGTIGFGHLRLGFAGHGKDPARRQQRNQSDRECKAPARTGDARDMKS